MTLEADCAYRVLELSFTCCIAEYLTQLRSFASLNLLFNENHLLLATIQHV